MIYAHDPFDDIAHPSRYAVVLIVVAFVATAAMRAMYGALVEASRRHGRIAAAATHHRSAYGTARAFAGGTIALAALEAIDALAAGRPSGDIGALFAGSPALALGVTAAIALLGTAIVRTIARAIVALRPALVAALVVLFFGARDATERAAFRHARSYRRDRQQEPLSIRGANPPPPLLPTA
ncbi:MAG: hypothetical protein NVSMB21_23870 [Vulcanimicrobiaceae bacterium]